MDSEFLKGSTTLLILSMLSEGPKYGYQMMETVRERSNDAYRIKEGALYPSLKKLESLGHIRAQWEIQPNGRERCYYLMMPSGYALLQEKWSSWQGFLGMMHRLVKEPVQPIAQGF